MLVLSLSSIVLSSDRTSMKHAKITCRYVRSYCWFCAGGLADLYNADIVFYTHPNTHTHTHVHTHPIYKPCLPLEGKIVAL
jgi:hypothetical protein